MRNPHTAVGALAVPAPAKVHQIHIPMPLLSAVLNAVQYRAAFLAPKYRLHLAFLMQEPLAHHVDVIDVIGLLVLLAVQYHAAALAPSK
jgi:hypothetical protein